MQAYSISEVCERARISRTTLYKLIGQGTGPIVTKIGRRSVIFETDLHAWQSQLPKGVLQ
jgi:excisionase family DNA binding protein